jgi:predicted transcriptional regulator
MCQQCCCTLHYNEEGCNHGRRFLTKAEKIEKLRKYEEELKKELTALQEHIKELSS